MLRDHNLVETYFFTDEKKHIPESTFLVINGAIGKPKIARHLVINGNTYLLFQEFLENGLTMAEAREKFGKKIPKWFEEQSLSFTDCLKRMYKETGLSPQATHPYSKSVLVSERSRGIYLVDTNLLLTRRPTELIDFLKI